MENLRQVRRDMLRNIIFAIAAVVIGLAAAVFGLYQGRREAMLQQSIAGEVIRFHILANSDSEEDQELKLTVRDEVLLYLEALLEGSEGVEDSRQRIRKSLEEIREVAQECVEEQGYSYPVTAKLVKDNFPQKTYGDCIFPAGNYEALRIEIGEGQGHNWWCMVYPGLCFTEDNGAYVSQESKELLHQVLTEEEFQLVTGEGRLVLRSGFLRWLTGYK